MIKKIVFLGLLFLLNSFQSFGQQDEKSLPKWHVNLGGNAHFSISNFKQNIPIDFLFDYGAKVVYPQFSFSGIYFFHPKWGATLKGNIGIPSIKKSRDLDFENSLRTFYQNAFFVNSIIGAQYDPHENADGIYFGITYRKRKGKWVYLPQLLMGLTSFRVDQGNVYLKEKDTNTIFQISYSSDDKPEKEYFTIVPAFSLGYYFRKKWMFNFDVQYGFFQMNVNIDEEKRNTFTEEIKRQTYSYKNNLHFINLGFSITRIF